MLRTIGTTTILLAGLAPACLLLSQAQSAPGAPAPLPLPAVADSDTVTVRMGRLGRNQTWTGSLGDAISVTWDTRRGQTVTTGTLKSVTRDRKKKVNTITLGTPDGENITVFVQQVVRIETSGGMPASTPEQTGTDRSSAMKAEEGDRNPVATPEPATSHAWGFPTTPGLGEEENWPRVFLLPFEGTVGSYAREEEIRAVAEVADQYGDGQIIVLLVDSPGGLVAEGDEISVTLRQIQKRHRLVAWIRSAISAAAFTSFHCREIVFMNSGELGAITMFRGADNTSAEGAELAAWVEEVGNAAESGDHSRELAEAMVTNSELCSYDPADGDKGPVIYGTLEGKVVLSTEEENLTINATTARDCGFSIGTANTEAELAALLGLPRWYETTDDGRTIHQKWHRKLERAADELPDLMARAFGGRGASSDPIKSMNVRLSALRGIIKWAKDLGAHTWAVIGRDVGTNLPPLEYLEMQERDLSEQLARMRANRR